MKDKLLENRKQLALDLLTSHNLTAWTFKFDNAKRRGGLCNYNKKLITIAKGYAEKSTDSQYRDTVLHEIAHALAPGAKHGQGWKKVAQNIGCTAERCHNVTFSEPKYLLYCQNNCFTPIKRHKISDVSRRVCAKCRSHVKFIER